MTRSNNLDIALMAALDAGKKIMEVYNSTENIAFESKSDSSPLTLADKRSHKTIVDHLKNTF